jgi:hypothetical protein
MMTSLRKAPLLSFGAFALFLACWLLFRGEEFVPSVDSEGAGATHLDARMSSPGHAVHADSAPGRMPLQRWVVQVLSREGEPLHPRSCSPCSCLAGKSTHACTLRGQA